MGSEAIPSASGERLRELTIDSFSRRLNESFEVDFEGGARGAFEAELIEVQAASSGGGEESRQPFSVLLRGPLVESPEQGIHRVEHEAMGAMRIFLVPVGPDDAGMLYEAIFT